MQANSAGCVLGLPGNQLQGAGLLQGAGVIRPGLLLRASRVLAVLLPLAGLVLLAAAGALPGSVRAATDRVPSHRASEPAAGSSAAANPDLRCAGCHRAIVERYEKTPMARASGTAMDGLIPADFRQATTGVEYRIAAVHGQAELLFSRPAMRLQGVELPALHGSRELRYAIGSGLRGRTYLFEEDGYWFEAPINWYARKRMWDMAPNFLEASEMPLTLPVDPGCLRCHATGARPSMEQARNRYAGAPFAQGGIGCAACHGDPTEHLATGGRAAMLVLDRLPAEERDSICLSCHMEGQAAIVHAGRRLEDFRPGESIWQYASFYVHASEKGSGGRATGQWEALLASACKRAAGDRMTCTTCHDPHGSDRLMTAAERVDWYRGRCLSCHETAGGGFSATHHPEQRDCTSCHMQRAESNDIAHEQVTDHRIVRRFAGRSIPPATRGPLVEVGAKGMLQPADSRELGLAYAQFAALGDRAAYARALAILKQVAAEPAGSSDATVQAQLGFLEQLGGADQPAAAAYAQALREQPEDSFAEGNLGLILARHGEAQAAVRLWRSALALDPAQTATGVNLATVECGLGDREDALAALEQVLAFAPDDRQALALEGAIREGKQRCGSRAGI